MYHVASSRPHGVRLQHAQFIDVQGGCSKRRSKKWFKYCFLTSHWVQLCISRVIMCTSAKTGLSASASAAGNLANEKRYQIDQFAVDLFNLPQALKMKSMIKLTAVLRRIRMLPHSDAGGRYAVDSGCLSWKLVWTVDADRLYLISITSLFELFYLINIFLCL